MMILNVSGHFSIIKSVREGSRILMQRQKERCESSMATFSDGIGCSFDVEVCRVDMEGQGKAGHIDG